MQLAISGCMPQHAQKFLKENIPYLDYVVGVNNMEYLPEFLFKKPTLDEQFNLLLPNRRNDKAVRSFEDRLKSQKKIIQ